MSDVESDEDEGLTESDPEIEEENGTNKRTGQPHQRKFDKFSCYYRICIYKIKINLSFRHKDEM